MTNEHDETDRQRAAAHWQAIGRPGRGHPYRFARPPGPSEDEAPDIWPAPAPAGFGPNPAAVMAFLAGTAGAWLSGSLYFDYWAPDRLGSVAPLLFVIAIGGLVPPLVVVALHRAYRRRCLRRTEQHDLMELNRLTPIAEWIDAYGRKCRYTLSGLVAGDTILCVVPRGGSLAGILQDSRQGLRLRLDSPHTPAMYRRDTDISWLGLGGAVDAYAEWAQRLYQRRTGDIWNPLAPLWSTVTVILPPGSEGERVAKQLLTDPRIEDSRVARAE